MTFARRSGCRAAAASIVAIVATASASCGGGNSREKPSQDASAATDDATSTEPMDDAGDDGPPVLIAPTDAASPCRTCKGSGWTCGKNSDGCGNIIDCGTCQAPLVCGGAGYSKCGPAVGDGGPCVPTTCKNLGYDCGPAGDGCGGLLQCGQCSTPFVCGSAGPGVCGLPCSGLCAQQQACESGATTSVTGRVVAGTLPVYGSPDPVPNVVVYVPNAPLVPFAPGVQCSTCGAEVTGNPLVTTHTAYDGTFTLSNVPSGDAIPIVLQLGRWRRMVTFKIPPCASTALGDVHMPRNQGEGDIPRTAISTGSVDAMECVLLKMGVDAAEFTPDTGSGRIHIFSGYDPDGGANGSGASAGPGTRPESALTGDHGQTLFLYDQVLFPCWGDAYVKGSDDLANLVFYANQGGRVFATHFSYSWLFQNSPFDRTATWDPNHGSSLSITGRINVSSNGKGPIFANWLGLVGALSSVTPPQVSINSPRHDVDTVGTGATDWIDGIDPSDGTPELLHFTFDTPLDASARNQCGHVIYSDFHVAESSASPMYVFPSECRSGAMTPQEKILEYMIWDLQSCVGSPPMGCVPRSCAEQNLQCGPAGDGCGGLIQCGSCKPPLTCGGGGGFAVCGSSDGGPCHPQTCAQQGISCGPAADGCGHVLDCGKCTAPQTCGGAGMPGQCGMPPE